MGVMRSPPDGCSASLLETQYNCKVGAYDSWDHGKEKYCCKVMRSPPDGCSASLLETQYNCKVGAYDSCDYGKEKYCCKVMRSPPDGCSGLSLLQEGIPGYQAKKEAVPASLLETQYNCKVGAENYDSWDYGKKKYCCKVMRSPPDGCSGLSLLQEGIPGYQAKK